MSTRCNVIVTDDSNDHLIFYRHSDGYPEGAVPPLQILLSWIKRGRIRDGLVQMPGWIIMIGAIEYNTIPKFELESDGKGGDLSTIKLPEDWKVGAYETTTDIHGDIEHLYVLDLKAREVREIQIPTGKQKWQDMKVIKTWGPAKD